jgi:hypothetical protein
MPKRWANRSRLPESAVMKAVAETAVLTNRRCEGWGSVQGALSVTRPPEVSRFGSFVKPTADWF